MGRGKGLWWCLVHLTLLLIDRVMCSQDRNKSCSPSQCGIIKNIRHPFRLRHDPPNCGDPNYEIACENNVPLVQLNDATYRVLGINYNNYTIRLVDPGIQEGNCSSLPLHLLSLFNFTDAQYYDYYFNAKHLYITNYDNTLDLERIFNHVVYLKCWGPVTEDGAYYVDTAPCVNWESGGEGGGHLYAVVVGDLLAGELVAMELKYGCRVKWVAPIASSGWASPEEDGGNLSYAEIHKVLSYGFEISWWRQACTDLSCPIDSTCTLNPATLSLRCSSTRWRYCDSPMGIEYEAPCPKLPKLRIIAEDYVYGIYKGLRQIVRKGTYDHWTSYDFNLTNHVITLGIITGHVLPYTTLRFLFGIIFLFALLIYTCRRRHLSIYEDIEDFIRLHNLIPIRYSNKELKTMTEGFKNKLGEGGFGSVYKGKLRSGPDVAVKMLGKPKANGQEFISEVATIGRIHHFNVVHLVGFCVEGTKHALVYEFMSNGSLDKYIFSKAGSVFLSYRKIYEISLGVAHGIAYLHHGCDMQILHFDIKPHNILLDENFVPKISDFGLAKLHSVDDSVVTLTAARGTIGYMAPELFYKNIGRVSYKADVYSFGMLLMEMASRRRNLNPQAEHSSQLYFPLWIYDQFDEERDIEMEDLIEEEKDLVKKMLIVALWCIQLKPDDRPSMNKVIEMLEIDDVGGLEMPPKPSLYPDETILVDDGSNSGQTTSSVSVHSHSYPSEGITDGK